MKEEYSAALEYLVFIRKKKQNVSGLSKKEKKKHLLDKLQNVYKNFTLMIEIINRLYFIS